MQNQSSPRLFCSHRSKSLPQFASEAFILVLILRRNSHLSFYHYCSRHIKSWIILAPGHLDCREIEKQLSKCWELAAAEILLDRVRKMFLSFNRHFVRRTMGPLLAILGFRIIFHVQWKRKFLLRTFHSISSVRREFTPLDIWNFRRTCLTSLAAFVYSAVDPSLHYRSEKVKSTLWPLMDLKHCCDSTSR